MTIIYITILFFQGLKHTKETLPKSINTLIIEPKHVFFLIKLIIFTFRLLVVITTPFSFNPQHFLFPLENVMCFRSSLSIKNPIYQTLWIFGVIVLFFNGFCYHGFYQRRWKMPPNSYNGNGNFVIRAAKMGIFVVQPTPRNQMGIVDRLSFPPSSLRE